MNDFADAFQELLDANDEACGTPQFVLINNRKVRCVRDTNTADDLLLAGGIGQQGGYRAQVAKSDFAQAPEKGDAIISDGQKLDIIAVDEVNGSVYILTAGDLSAEDRG